MTQAYVYIRFSTIEQEDGRFLEEHGLPDGNLYKMENYDGVLNNQGRAAATDKSDLARFTDAYRNGTPSESWWRENFDALRSIGYDGWMVIEAFGLALPELAAATKIWRRMFDTELKLAEEGLKFMKEQVALRA